MPTVPPPRRPEVPVRITLHSDTELVLSDLHVPGMEVEAAPGVHAHFSALQMFATSLGLCTSSVMMAYAEQLDVGTEALAVRLRWRLEEDPLRVGDIEMDLHWPELPPTRVAAAGRAAEQCTLHNTLTHPPRLRTTVSRDAVSPEGHPPRIPPPEVLPGDVAPGSQA